MRLRLIVPAIVAFYLLAGAAAAQEAGEPSSPTTPTPAKGPEAREQSAPEGVAEECPARPADDEQARKLAGEWFTKAEALYVKEQSEKALEAFLCSLELVEHPATLFNAAQAARSAGDHERAYQLLRRYRELVPKSDMSELVSKQITELEQRLAKLEKSVSVNDKDGQAAVTEGGPEESHEPDLAAVDSEQQDRPADEGSSSLTIPGYVAIGLGGALVVGGAVTGGMALSVNGDLADQCQGGECPASSRDDLDRRDTLASTTNILIVLGVASATAGVLMLTVFSGEQEPPSDLAVSPVLAPGFGGAAARGSF